jgi:hypothetical protein
MFDISAVREGYNERIIANIGLIRSEFNAADAMTKLAPDVQLNTNFRTQSVHHPNEQYAVDSRLLSVKWKGELSSTNHLVCRIISMLSYLLIASTST